MNFVNLLQAYRKAIKPPYTHKDLPTIIPTLFILIAIPITVIAVISSREPRGRAVIGGPTLYLSPASLTVNQGTTFSVQVRENSVTEPVNAVQANLTYDSTKLNFVSLDDPPVGTLFKTVAEGSGGAGSIRIARSLEGGVPAAVGDQLVATVIFRARYSLGSTSVGFDAGSAIVRSTDNTNILVTTSGGSYTVIDPPPTVIITNPTNGATVTGTINIKVNITDDLGVTKVEFYKDSDPTPIATDTTDSFETTWDTNSVADGNHSLYAKAYDIANVVTSTLVTVTVANTVPTVDIKADGSDGPVSIPYNAAATLSWTSTHATSCTASGAWSGSKSLSGSASTGNLISDKTYTLTCTNLSGSDSDSVGINVVKIGDLNDDNKIDIFDLSILLSRWGTTDAAADLNKNGTVDILDLSILLTNWGT